MSEFTGILAEIDNVIGAALTLKLVSECGGSTIYIPKKPTEKMPLCQLLGVENVKKLSLALGSGELLIPMSYFRGMGKKKVQIAQMLEKGVSVSEIVKRWSFMNGRSTGSRKKTIWLCP